jgi:2-methylcitrate dehydratase PrpD
MNTALFDLLATHKIEAARVRHVAIALSQTAYDMHGGFGTYKGKFEALLSAHFAAAAILHDRALGLAQFAPQCYDDPTLRAFAAEKVEVRADATVSGSQAQAEIVLEDGARLAARCDHPLGSFENPLSRAQVEQKFRSYAADVLSEARIEEVIDAVGRLEDFGSVRKLMTLLRATPRARAIAAAE